MFADVHLDCRQPPNLDATERRDAGQVSERTPRDNRAKTGVGQARELRAWPPSHGAAPIGSPLCFGEALQDVRIREVNMSVPDLHGTRFPQPREGPGECLPVRSYHARELIVGVAGGYHAAAVGSG